MKPFAETVGMFKDGLMLLAFFLFLCGLGLCRDCIQEFSKDPEAIPVADLQSTCIPCSPEYITDGCVPSLCVQRKSGAYCCVTKYNYPR
jgi:hypothetical protein